MNHSSKEEVNTFVFCRPARMMIPVPHVTLDPTIETEQGQERTVRQLYEDFVLGKLDMRDIGGSVQYDPDDATEVDPLNNFGVTLEETTDIADRGAAAKKEVAQHLQKKREADAAAKAAAKAASANNPPAD